MEVMLWELVEQSKNGDKEALMKLIKKFEPLIKKYTKELNYEEAETDLIISFIEILKDINLSIFPVKNDGLVVNYIVRSLNHKKINLYRRYVTNMQESLEINMELICDESDTSHKSRIIFEDLISCLPRLQRRVIKERFLLGYSYKEIADRLNITRQAVNGIKNRALNNLRKRI
ncbi:RNA polymerase sigma factor [Lutispora thermophila]|uniref:RNA polymerase sigma factor, sigma-70 family n=1 Tax=Lutispora thermophila DSM 19022 TaxID=1122184 RepID=A0A1M6IN24_9FIRM|nr:sigma-70 family RNA polymerase sigma factor [Lutispora thermophila]SHJ35906.1 RNA polymerase sigma factor, sigma-70 family [Lutispora thermophila DSM 19022]